MSIRHVTICNSCGKELPPHSTNHADVCPGRRSDMYRTPPRRDFRPPAEIFDDHGRVTRADINRLEAKLDQILAKLNA